MNKSQLCIEDINTGDLLPPLIKHPTPRQMVMWAGVSGDYYEIHYDRNFAAKLGLPDILVQGGLVASFLGQMITDWIGENGILQYLQTINRQMMFPEQPITCKGKVISKCEDSHSGQVECEIWAEGNQGTRLIEGKAKVSLPKRAMTALK